MLRDDGKWLDPGAAATVGPTSGRAALGFAAPAASFTFDTNEPKEEYSGWRRDAFRVPQGPLGDRALPARLRLSKH